MKSLIPLLLSLITLTAALPADDPIDAILSALDLQGLAGKGTPPLPTTIHSPECANLNGGTYVCCESTLNGGFPLVKELSALADYPLTDNTINGLINCESFVDATAIVRCYVWRDG